MPRLDLNTVLQITEKLPSLPQPTLRALEIINDPMCNIRELARVIGLDESLATRLLQWANSPFYGLRYKVSTLEQAIMVVGTVAVRDLLLAASVSEMINRKMVGYGLERGDLWRHSVAVAAGAQQLAIMHRYERPDQVMVAGLTHDIGKLVIDELLRLDRGWLAEWNQLREQGVSFLELERLVTGLDHAQLGGRIAEHWNLPEVLYEAIAFHHDPGRAVVEPRVVHWVHVADAAALMLGIGLGYDGLSYIMSEESLLAAGLDGLDLEELMRYEAAAVSEAESLFHLPARQRSAIPIAMTSMQNR
ncbi:MAG: HDOD domain-containing protein [Anaerolineae bacterium]|nr:HDOD domain-containing protein [Anaerolineae bacterium]MDW8098038.1 HDOD domain-containing protein [Anaerolineae bacterium]